MNIGAGTVINAEQCEEAIEASARFAVSSGLSVGYEKDNEKATYSAQNLKETLKKYNG